MELFSDYQCTINYHPGKANVVADALSRKISVASLMVKEWKMLEDVRQWKPFASNNGLILASIRIQPSLLEEIKEAQEGDHELQKIKSRLDTSDASHLTVAGNGLLRYRGRICVPSIGRIKEYILMEAHHSRYTIHPGGTKMYYV